MPIFDQRDTELARVLIRHSVKAAKGDLVYIDAVGLDTVGLAEALCVEAARVGAAPYIHLSEPETTRRLLHEGSEGVFRRLAEFELLQMKNTTCYIGIRGPQNSFESADVPPRKMDLYNRYIRRPVHLEQRVKHTRWCVVRYPNAGMAQLAQQPREKFADFYYKVCTHDYAAMERACRPLSRLMAATDRVHLKGPGTDLRFSIKSIPNVPCFGTHNIPDGECFTAPVRDSIEGTVAFNSPTIWEGHCYEQITLTFEKGRVVRAAAANRDQTKRLNRILTQDDGASYVGEFSIAFNPHILHPMRDILFDEKIAGSFHMALGQAYEEADNGNRSALHWDMVCIQRPEYGGGEMWFDGKLIRKDGIFLPKTLQGLNP
jgi:aminopeptidase